MKIKLFMAISASVLFAGANLFVISARQGSVNCKELLAKAFSFNHFAYAEDPGYNDGTSATGSNYADGYADCSILSVESYNIDVALNSNAGQNLKKYADAGGDLSTSGVPYVNGHVSVSGGNSSNNTSTNTSNTRIVGTMYVDVRAARPQYVYCDYHNNRSCIEHTDPCNELKNTYRAQALNTFGL